MNIIEPFTGKWYVRFRVNHSTLREGDLGEVLDRVRDGDPNWYVEGDSGRINTTISFYLYGYKTYVEALEYAIDIVDLTSTWPNSRVVELLLSED